MTKTNLRFAIYSPNLHTRQILTSLVSVLDNTEMPGFIEGHEAIRGQYEADAKHIAALNAELSKLRPAFLKYKELSAEHAAVEERFRVLLGMIGYLFPEDKVRELDVIPGVAVESPQDERRKTPLWKVLRELARQVTEIRIVEMEAGLKQYGYKFSRQAIESAIDTHRDVFRSTRRGRERFVSLK